MASGSRVVGDDTVRKAPQGNANAQRRHYSAGHRRSVAAEGKIDTYPRPPLKLFIVTHTDYTVSEPREPRTKAVVTDPWIAF